MMETKVLAAKERRIQSVYDMIKTAYDECRYPPSIREICIELDISSTSTVHSYLAELERRGMIIVHHGVNRGIMIAKQAG